MAKVFEDEFTEIQSGMVSLAIEALETADMTVDKIYIYAFGTEHEGFFNLFFVKDGKLLHNHQVGVSEEIIDQVLDLGIDDTFQLLAICKRYGRQAPCQYKLVYDCNILSAPVIKYQQGIAARDGETAVVVMNDGISGTQKNCHLHGRKALAGRPQKRLSS